MTTRSVQIASRYGILSKALGGSPPPRSVWSRAFLPLALALAMVGCGGGQVAERRAPLTDSVTVVIQLNGPGRSELEEYAFLPGCDDCPFRSRLQEALLGSRSRVHDSRSVVRPFRPMFSGRADDARQLLVEQIAAVGRCIVSDQTGDQSFPASWQTAASQLENCEGGTARLLHLEFNAADAEDLGRLESPLDAILTRYPTARLVVYSGRLLDRNDPRQRSRVAVEALRAAIPTNRTVRAVGRVAIVEGLPRELLRTVVDLAALQTGGQTPQAYYRTDSGVLRYHSPTDTLVRFEATGSDDPARTRLDADEMRHMLSVGDAVFVFDARSGVIFTGPDVPQGDINASSQRPSLLLLSLSSVEGTEVPSAVPGVLDLGRFLSSHVLRDGASRSLLRASQLSDILRDLGEHPISDPGVMSALVTTANREDIAQSATRDLLLVGGAAQAGRLRRASSGLPDGQVVITSLPQGFDERRAVVSALAFIASARYAMFFHGEQSYLLARAPVGRELGLRYYSVVEECHSAPVECASAGRWVSDLSNRVLASGSLVGALRDVGDPPRLVPPAWTSFRTSQLWRVGAAVPQPTTGVGSSLLGTPLAEGMGAGSSLLGAASEAVEVSLRGSASPCASQELVDDGLVTRLEEAGLWGSAAIAHAILGARGDEAASRHAHLRQALRMVNEEPAASWALGQVVRIIVATRHSGFTRQELIQLRVDASEAVLRDLLAIRRSRAGWHAERAARLIVDSGAFASVREGAALRVVLRSAFEEDGFRELLYREMIARLPVRLMMAQEVSGSDSRSTLNLRAVRRLNGVVHELTPQGGARAGAVDLADGGGTAGESSSGRIGSGPREQLLLAQLEFARLSLRRHLVERYIGGSAGVEETNLRTRRRLTELLRHLRDVPPGPLNEHERDNLHSLRVFALASLAVLSSRHSETSSEHQVVSGDEALRRLAVLLFPAEDRSRFLVAAHRAVSHVVEGIRQPDMVDAAYLLRANSLLSSVEREIRANTNSTEAIEQALVALAMRQGLIALAEATGASTPRPFLSATLALAEWLGGHAGESTPGTTRWLAASATPIHIMAGLATGRGHDPAALSHDQAQAMSISTLIENLVAELIDPNDLRLQQPGDGVQAYIRAVLRAVLTRLQERGALTETREARSLRVRSALEEVHTQLDRNSDPDTLALSSLVIAQFSLSTTPERAVEVLQRAELRSVRSRLSRDHQMLLLATEMQALALAGNVEAAVSKADEVGRLCPSMQPSAQLAAATIQLRAGQWGQADETLSALQEARITEAELPLELSVTASRRESGDVMNELTIRSSALEWGAASPSIVFQAGATIRSCFPTCISSSPTEEWGISIRGRRIGLPEEHDLRVAILRLVAGLAMQDVGRVDSAVGRLGEALDTLPPATRVYGRGRERWVESSGVHTQASTVHLLGWFLARAGAPDMSALLRGLADERLGSGRGVSDACTAQVGRVVSGDAPVLDVAERYCSSDELLRSLTPRERAEEFELGYLTYSLTGVLASEGALNSPFISREPMFATGSREGSCIPLQAPPDAEGSPPTLRAVRGCAWGRLRVAGLVRALHRLPRQATLEQREALLLELADAISVTPSDAVVARLLYILTIYHANEQYVARYFPVRYPEVMLPLAQSLGPEVEFNTLAYSVAAMILTDRDYSALMQRAQVLLETTAVRGETEQFIRYIQSGVREPARRRAADQFFNWRLR